MTGIYVAMATGIAFRTCSGGLLKPLAALRVWCGDVVELTLEVTLQLILTLALTGR